MSRKRKAISLEQQLAAALACLLEPSLRDAARAARLPARSIIRMFTNHHLDFHALGGGDEWWNLHPMTRIAHEEARAELADSYVARIGREADRTVTRDFARDSASIIAARARANVRLAKGGAR